LAPWEGSMTWRSGVATSVGGEAASGRGKGGDNTSWMVKKINTVDSAATNGW
jgi:hypothetical protein